MLDDPWDIIRRLEAAHAELLELATGDTDASLRRGAGTRTPTRPRAGGQL